MHFLYFIFFIHAEEIARRRMRMEEDIKELDDEDALDLARDDEGRKIEEMRDDVNCDEEEMEGNDKTVELNQTSINGGSNNVASEEAADSNDTRSNIAIDDVESVSQDIPMADQEFEPIYD